MVSNELEFSMVHLIRILTWTKGKSQNFDAPFMLLDSFYLKFINPFILKYVVIEQLLKQSGS